MVQWKFLLGNTCEMRHPPYILNTANREGQKHYKSKNKLYTQAHNAFLSHIYLFAEGAKYFRYWYVCPETALFMFSLRCRLQIQTNLFTQSFGSLKTVLE